MVSIDSQVPETLPNKIIMGDTGYDDPVLHAELEAIWNDDGQMIRQLVNQIMDPAVGGVLAVTPIGWDPGYEVRISVPANAIPGTTNVAIGIAIPVFGAPGTDNPTYEFFPDGINFLKEVDVTVCWPAWAGLPPTRDLDMIFVESIWREGDRHFKVTDRVTTRPAAVDETTPLENYTDFERATEITYKLDHFSRWGVTSGSDDGTDPGGNIIRTGSGSKVGPDLAKDVSPDPEDDVVLPGVNSGDSCWILLDNPLLPKID